MCIRDSPLTAAPICVLLGNRKLVYGFSLLVSWVVFAISVACLGQVIHTGEAIHYDIGGWKSPYGIEYIVDYLSGFVMMFVSGIGAIVLTYAPASIKKEIPLSKHYLFCPTYLLCLTGLLGICITGCLLYTSPSPRDLSTSRMPSSA